MNFFFSTYARPANYKNETRGFLQHIVPLYGSASPQSTLRYCTLALATFFLVAWTNHSLESKVSRMYYANAIAAMKTQLTSSIACSNDEMLLSILLLQLYEVRRAISNFNPSPPVLIQNYDRVLWEQSRSRLTLVRICTEQWLS